MRFTVLLVVVLLPTVTLMTPADAAIDRTTNQVATPTELGLPNDPPTSVCSGALVEGIDTPTHQIVAFNEAKNVAFPRGVTIGGLAPKYGGDRRRTRYDTTLGGLASYPHPKANA